MIYITYCTRIDYNILYNKIIIHKIENIYYLIYINVDNLETNLRT